MILQNQSPSGGRYLSGGRAPRISPIPNARTAAARNAAPTYVRFIKLLGSFTSSEATDRKNAEGIRIAAMGAPIRAIHFQKGESSAWTRVWATHNWGTRLFGFHLGQERSWKNCKLTWMEEE